MRRDDTTGQDGAAIVEYAILVALVAVVFIGGATAINLGAGAAFEAQSDDLSTVDMDGTGGSDGAGGDGSGGGDSGGSDPGDVDDGSGSGSDGDGGGGSSPSEITAGDLTPDPGSPTKDGKFWSTDTTILAPAVPAGTVLNLLWTPSADLENAPSTTCSVTVGGECRPAVQAVVQNGVKDVTLTVTGVGSGPDSYLLDPQLELTTGKP